MSISSAGGNWARCCRAESEEAQMMATVRGTRGVARRKEGIVEH